MYKSEREDEILSLLADCEYATVESLVEKINISASSIRRDLKALEARGLVLRSYGGVKLAERRGRTPREGVHAPQSNAQDRQLARTAHALIRPGETLLLDASGAACALAELLTEDADLTVFTNSVAVLSVLSGTGIKTYCTGGVLSNGNRAALVGEDARAFLSRIRVDAAFCAADAVTPSGECFGQASEETALRRTMLANARRKILLCRSHTWGADATFYQAHMEEIDLLVTDRDPTAFFSEPTPEKYRF